MNSIAGFVRLRNFSFIVDGNLLLEDTTDKVGNFFQFAYEALLIEYPKFHKMDRLSQAGFLAAELLLTRHSVRNYAPAEVALVLANAHASMDTDKRYTEAAAVVSSPALFVYTLPNIVAGEICIRHSLKGENAFFVTKHFDPDLMETYVNQIMLQDPSTKACIAGWVDIMDEHHDVLLYLVEKQHRGLNLPHHAQQLNLLYQ